MSDAKPTDLAGVVDGDDRRVAARMLVDPGELLGEGAGHEIERHRRLEHLDVVDRAQRLGVATLDEAGSERTARHGRDATQPRDGERRLLG